RHTRFSRDWSSDVCSSDLSAPPDAPAPSATSPTSEAPVTVTNCGFEVTVPTRPERIVTIKSSTTELALALGLAERVVAAAFLDRSEERRVGEAWTDRAGP